MSDNTGKLWLEMGVRDQVSEQITKAEEAAIQLGKNLDDVTRNADKLTKALYKTAEVKDRLDKSINESKSLGLDTSRLEQGMSLLNDFENKLKSINKKDFASNKDNIQGMVGADYQQMIRSLTEASKQQNKINSETEKRNIISKQNEIAMQDKVEQILNQRRSQRENSEYQAAQKRVQDEANASNKISDIKEQEALSDQKWEQMKSDADRKFRTQRLQYQMEASEKEQQMTNQANQQLMSTMDRLNDKGSYLKKTFGEIGNQLAMTFSVYGLERFLTSIIKIGGEFEQQHIALQNILGNKQQADSIFSQTKSLAVESPFTFKDLATYTKQLAAFQVPTNELFDTNKRLSDLSAGLGVDMNRLILAYGQVRSASVLRGQELRQFTEAGIPMVQALADQFTKLNHRVVTTGDVFKLISERAVPFEMVKKVLWDMTNEGGKFYNMQYVLSDTLLGKWSNLNDAWQIMLSGLAKGESMSGKILKGFVQGLTSAINGMNILMPLISSYLLATGTVRATKFVSNFVSGGLNKTESSFLKAKGVMANDITQKRMQYGEDALSEREKEILSTKKMITEEDYRLLASSGKLNMLELNKLYSKKAISNETIAQLVNEKKITLEEAQQIMNGSRFKMVWNNAISGIWSGIKSIISSPTVWLTAALSVYMLIQQHIDDMASQMKSVTDDALQKYNSINNTKNDLGSKGRPTSNEGLKTGITTLDQSLKENAYNYPEIKAQADGIKDLGEKYDFLNKKLNETADAYKNTSEFVVLFQSAMEDTGGLKTAGNAWEIFKSVLSGNWLSDSMQENMKDFDKYQNEIKKYSSDITLNASIIQTSISDIGKKDPQFMKSLNGKKIEDQIRIVANSPYWLVFQSHLGNISRGAYNAVNNYIGAVRDANAVQKQINEQSDTFTKRLLSNPKFKKMSDSEKRQIIDSYVKSIQDISDEVRRRTENKILIKMELKPIIRVSAPVSTVYQNESTTGKQLLGLIRQRYGNGKMTVAQINEIAPQDATDSDILTNIQTRRKKIQEEYKAAKALGHDTKSLQNEFEAVNYLANHFGLKDKNDSLFDYKKNKNKKDSWLDEMNHRITMLDKFMSLYEEKKARLGEEDAKSEMSKNTDFRSLRAMGITDPSKEVSNLKKIYEDLVANQGKSMERRQKAEEVYYKWKDAREKESAKIAEDSNKNAVRALELENKKWETYKKWFDATGDMKLANSIAFGGTMQYTSERESLKSQINSNPSVIRKGLNADSLLNLGDNRLNSLFGEAGKRSDGLREKIEKYRESVNKWSEDTADAMLKVLEKSKDYDTQLADIDRKYQDYIAYVNELKGVSQTDKERMIDQAGKQSEQDKGKIKFDLLKKTSDWEQIFGDLDRVPTNTIKDMIKQINILSKTTDQSPENMKILSESKNKMQKELDTRNPITSLIENTRINNRRRQLLNSGGVFSGENDTYTFKNEKSAQYYGYLPGQTVSKKQVSNDIKSGESDINKSTAALSDKFRGLQDVLSPVINLFDTLGNETLSNIFQSGSNALGAAAGVSNGLNALGLSSLGPYGAAFGAAMSITSSLFAMHDKAIDAEIQASKQRQKEMENLSANLKTVLESTLGGVYTFKADTAEQQKLAKYIKPGDYGYISSSTKSAISAAQSSGWTYYNTEFASLKSQRDEVQHQMDEEKDKKKTDWDKVSDYEQNLTELDQKITTFATDMAKELYSIDFKSISQNIASSLIDAWASGESAVDAYKKTVKDAMKDILKSVIGTQYVEQILAPFEKAFVTAFTKDNGVITVGSDSYNALSDLMSASETVISSVNGAMDAAEQIAKKNGYTLRDETTSSSMAGSIKSNTEEEIGLVASYTNAMRADLSYNKINIDKIAKEILPKFNETFSGILLQVKQISENTKRSADNSDDIKEILKNIITPSTNGGYKVKV